MTPAQRKIALDYGIPLRLAHTVNVGKAHKYFEWKNSGPGRIECFLDGRCIYYLEEIRKEYMRRDL